MSEEFKVKVGVDVDVSNLQSQLNRKIKGNNKIQVDLDIKNANSRVDELKKKIESLSNIKVNIGGLGKASTSSGNVDSFVKNTNNQLKNASEAFKKLQSIQQEIKTSRQNLSFLDSSTDSAAIDNLTKKINNLIVEYDKLYAAKSKSMSSVERSALNNEYSANITPIKQTTEAAKELLRISKQIGSLELKIKGLDGATEANQVKELSSQLKSLKKTYSELRESLNGQLSAGQLKSLNDVIATTENKLNQLDAKVTDAKKNLAEKISNNLTPTGDITKSFGDIESKYKQITNVADTTIDSMNRLKEAMANVKSANETFLNTASKDEKIVATDNLISAYNELEAATKSANNAIHNNIRDEKDAAAAAKAEASAQKEATAAMQLRYKANNLSQSMDLWLKRNSAAAETFGGQIRSLQAELQSCDATRLSGIQSEFKTITTQAEIAGKTGLTFADGLKQKFAELSSYFSAASIIMTGIQTVKEMAQNVLDVDTQMTELKRVTDLTTDQYAGIYDRLISSAQEYGTQLTDLISATADWSRAGFDADVAAGLAEITSVYQHIADLDYDTSAENLLTAYKGFQTQLDEQFGNDETAAVTHIADVYNEIDNNYATTAADIGEAVKRSASALSLAGNSLEETAGMVTGITEVTQDPEKAGNSLKVLSMRIRGKLSCHRTRKVCTLCSYCLCYNNKNIEDSYIRQSARVA